MLFQPLHQDCFDLHPEVRAAWKPSFSKERLAMSQPLDQKPSLLRRKRSSWFSFSLQKRDTSGGTAGWVLCAPIATPLLTPSWEEWAHKCWRDDVRWCSYIILFLSLTKKYARIWGPALLRRKRSSWFSFSLQKRDTSGGIAGWVLWAPVATPLLTPSWEEWTRKSWRDDAWWCSYIILYLSLTKKCARNCSYCQVSATECI